MRSHENGHDELWPAGGYPPETERREREPQPAKVRRSRMTGDPRNGEKPTAPVQSIQTIGGATVVALAGEVNSLNAPTLHAALVALANERPKCLVVDLTDVSYIDSAGMGTLVEILRRARAYKGKMMLCGVVGHVRSVIEITKLDHLFTICDNAEQAATI